MSRSRIICVCWMAVLGCWVARGAEAEPLPPMARLIAEIFTENGPVRPPYELARYDVAVEPAKDITELTARALKRQETLEAIWWLLKNDAEKPQRTGAEAADFKLLAYAFGEGKLDDAKAAADAAGAAHPLRLARLLVAECRYHVAVPMLIQLAEGDGALADEALASLAFMAEGRAAMKKVNVSLLPLPVDLEAWLTACTAKDPARRALVFALRKATLVRLSSDRVLEGNEERLLDTREAEVALDIEDSTGLAEIFDDFNPDGLSISSHLARQVNPESLKSVYLQTEANSFVLYRPVQRREFVQETSAEFRLSSAYNGPITFHLYRFKDRDEWEKLTPDALAAMKPERTWEQEFRPLRENNQKANQAHAVQVQDLSEGFFLVAAEARYAPVLAGQKFAVSHVALYVRAARNRAIVVAVNRTTGVPVSGVPVQLTVNSRASSRNLLARGGEKSDAFRLGFEKQDFTPGNEPSAWPVLPPGDLAQYREGAELRARYPDGEQTFNGKTGDDGLTVFDVDIGRPEYTYSLHARRVGPGEAEVSVAYVEPDTPADHLKSVVWFSQPVYRPGGTARFKGIIRRFNGIRVAPHEAGWKDKVTVEVKNDSGMLWKGDCAVTAAGAFSGEFPLSASAGLGGYKVLVDGCKTSPTEPLKIEHFRLPTFHVWCSMDQGNHAGGTMARGRVHVRYFSGEPAGGAEVEVSLDKSEPAVQTFVTTDAQGVATFEVPVPAVSEDRDCAVLATAMDASGESYSSSAWFHSRAAPFQLNVRAEPETVFEKGPVRIRVEAAGWDGKPVIGATVSVSGAARAEVTDDEGVAFVTHSGIGATGSQRLNVTATLGKDAAHGLCQFTVVAKPKEETAQTAEVQTLPTAEPEKAHQNKVDMISGDYSVNVGRPIKVSLDVDRTGGGATLVLFLIENLRSLKCQAALLKPGKHDFEFPTDADYVPSCKVSVFAFFGGAPREAWARTVYVAPISRFLTLEVTTGKRDYRPGERCVADVKAVDFRGEPVAQADVSLGVIHEAVYRIERDPTPDLQRFFHQYALPVYAVGHYDAPAPAAPAILYFKGPKYAWGFLYQASRGDFGMRSGGGRRMRAHGGGSSASERNLKVLKVRKDFRTEAHWVANLVTGNDGRARAEFDFPDDITEWRFTARGITADTKVGEVVHRERTILPVQVELVMPRALRAGDRITAGAVVRNNEGDARTVNVTLDKDAGNAQKELSIAKGLAQRVDFQLAPIAVCPLTLSAKAEDTKSKDGDAIERSLEVLPRGYPVGRSFSGTVKEGGEVALAFGEAGVPENLQVVFSVEPGLIGPVTSALDELIQYPYGCVEQTMSRFMPAVVAGRALKKGNLPNPREKDLAGVLDKGLERLAGFQHQDGGWGWWKEDATNDFMTAYVLEGLTLCRQAGHFVSVSMVEKAERYLFEQLVGEKLQGHTVGALGAASLTLTSAHALALGYAAEPERFAEQIKRLVAVVLKQNEWPHPRDAALLADTLRLLGKSDEARRSLAIAVQMIKTESNRSGMMAVATLLEAGAALEPADPRWMLKARELVKLRRGRGWGDTLTSAAAVRALSALISGPSKEIGPMDLLADGRVIGKLETKPNERVSVTLSGELAGAKVFSFRPAKEVAGDFFWSARETGFLKSPLPDDEKPVATVDVRVFTTGPEAKELEVGADGILNVKRGTTLSVRLVCSLNEPMEYLRISLPRPCGVELVRPPRRGRDVTAFEERDDGLHFFVREWAKGEHEVEFRVRAECAGEVFAPPPELEPMYAGAVPLKSRGPGLWRITEQ